MERKTAPLANFCNKPTRFSQEKAYLANQVIQKSENMSNRNLSFIQRITILDSAVLFICGCQLAKPSTFM
jgi:hypothetical protein